MKSAMKSGMKKMKKMNEYFTLVLKAKATATPVNLYTYWPF